jgi:NADH-quinone oxidoreductase subunit L
MLQLVWIIPFIPLIGFVINGLFGKKISKSMVGMVGAGTVLVSFILSLICFIQIKTGNEPQFTVNLFEWISIGSFKVPFSFLIDPLSSLMLLIVTGVGFLIHVYSIGYMQHDEGYYRYFAYLNLFMFSMLVLVLGANYPMMFIGWEGVGLCSYLLIGFWYQNNSYNNAARKAFVMNRIGDLGFLIGMFLLFDMFGSLNYDKVMSFASGYPSGDAKLTLATICLFIGATGKSAQLPLFTWLPDAMAGPTPVSALIHAATMVTAGIYMVVRSNILFTLSPTTQTIIATIGILTALLAAAIAITQNDIKKVLAYSTVSQLGYMFVALGVGAYTAAMFHVMTHAFFKALLFLGSGSVIHAMGGEQDIRKMGGLAQKLPITSKTFLVGCLAIAGIAPLSGFFSKDEILAHAFAFQPMVWFLGIVGAGLTAFYMFRLYYLTFMGTFRGTHEQEHHLHESPSTMTIPLMILAVLSVVGGFINVPEVFFGGFMALEHWLEPVLQVSVFKSGIFYLAHSTEIVIMLVSLLVAIASILFARFLYVQKNIVPAISDEQEPSFMYKLSQNKFYIDEIYEMLIINPLHSLSKLMYRFVEVLGIDGLVNGFDPITNRFSVWVAGLQTGKVGFYVFAMVAGIIALFLYNFF